jgi:hypothetical protein
MSERQVRPQLGYFLAPNLEDQAGSAFLDLNVRAAVRLAGKVALDHTLASPLLPDQARHRGAMMNRRYIGTRWDLSHR